MSVPTYQLNRAATEELGFEVYDDITHSRSNVFQKTGNPLKPDWFTVEVKYVGKALKNVPGGVDRLRRFVPWRQYPDAARAEQSCVHKNKNAARHGQWLFRVVPPVGEKDGIQIPPTAG